MKNIFIRRTFIKHIIFCLKGQLLVCGGRRSESEPDTEMRQEDLENSAMSP